jgi:large subunit ribosomal protein L10
VNRDEKNKFVSEIKDKISGQSSVLIVHYQGLTVEQMSALRGQMYQNGANLQVVKNRLMKIAIEGTVFDKLKDKFTGPVAIAYSSDPISAAKTVARFAKTNEKLKIIAGIVDNEVVDLARIEYLATIPSLDELRAKIIGLISAPASKLARVLNVYGSSNN